MSAPTRDETDSAPAPGQGFPPGPLTTAELQAAVPDRRVRDERYRRLWHGMYRRTDQPDDLWLRSVALARSWPDGVLRGRSAALVWGDDSAPADAPPEIWLPSTRKAAAGRVYRYGAMPARCITEHRITEHCISEHREHRVTGKHGLRVTTPLRTCRDLVADLPHTDAVVALDRMCAADHRLMAILAAVVAHPAGQADRELRRVVRDLDPTAPCADAARARALLGSAGVRGFAHGHEIVLGRRRVHPALADPRARCLVEVRTGPRTIEERARDERTWAALREAGWSVLVVGTAAGAGTETSTGVGTGAGTGTGTSAEPPGGHGRGTVADRARSVLGARWPDTELLEPLDLDAAVADPCGMWSAAG